MEERTSKAPESKAPESKAPESKAPVRKTTVDKEPKVNYGIKVVKLG
jgi:hypothetical protein